MSVFLCPKCNASLGEIGPAGILEAVCARCHYKFQVLKGRLPDRYEVLSICTNGEADQVPVRQGDTVSFVYTMHGDRREDLLFVTDHTTG
jgi:hypothetical protein